MACRVVRCPQSQPISVFWRKPGAQPKTSKVVLRQIFLKKSAKQSHWNWTTWGQEEARGGRLLVWSVLWLILIIIKLIMLYYLPSFEHDLRGLLVISKQGEWASQVAAVMKNLPVSAGDRRGQGSILGLGRSPREGNGNPLQCSCLENPMARRAWRAAVHRVSKSQTQLKRLST